MSAHLFSAVRTDANCAIEEPACIALQGAGTGDMRAGPDLDRLVAERIMDNQPPLPDFHPSTRIEDAFKVHQRMDREPNHVLAAYLSELQRTLFMRWRERTGARVIGPDTPGYLMELDAESICRAALKALTESGERAL